MIHEAGLQQALRPSLRRWSLKFLVDVSLDIIDILVWQWTDFTSILSRWGERATFYPDLKAKPSGSLPWTLTTSKNWTAWRRPQQRIFTSYTMYCNALVVGTPFTLRCVEWIFSEQQNPQSCSQSCFNTTVTSPWTDTSCHNLPGQKILVIISLDRHFIRGMQMWISKVGGGKDAVRGAS